MNKLALLLVTSSLLGGCFAQKTETTHVATVSPPKSIQAGPLQITAVNTEYGIWHGQFGRDSVNAWGVRVNVVNTSDHEVSVNFAEDDLKVKDTSGKQYSLSNRYQSIFTEIIMNEIYSQRLQGNLFFADTGGNAIIIRNGDTKIGVLSRAVIDEPNIHNVYTIELSPKKGVTLLFIFESPKESKLETLFWPKANPIDLR
ncbi:MAG TPA: hypothetical protein VGE85_03475 [Terracidiphilus sp.]|jgi:hypothetical protein